MTFKEAKDKLRVVFGITLTRRDGEYRVNIAGNGEATAYYTTDLADAFAFSQKLGLLNRNFPLLERCASLGRSTSIELKNKYANG
jgi:hypothetical protein